MMGRFPEDQIDHINHDKADNRWINLMIVSCRDNSRNFPKYKNNTSGSTGISWHKRDKKWTASIYVDGRKVHLGAYKNKKDAIYARAAADVKYGFHLNHGKVA
jgi:hypothetical protein